MIGHRIKFKCFESRSKCQLNTRSIKNLMSQFIYPVPNLPDSWIIHEPPFIFVVYFAALKSENFDIIGVHIRMIRFNVTNVSVLMKCK